MILHFKTEDHPEAAGRQPQHGDRAWTFRFKIVGGDELHLHMGRECHDTFRGFLLNEELDDAADEAMAELT